MCIHTTLFCYPFSFATQFLNFFKIYLQRRHIQYPSLFDPKIYGPITHNS
jgi:hypothetical protein